MRNDTRTFSAVIIGLALAASIVSLRNGFALDDVHIIADNERLHSLGNLWQLLGQKYWPPEHGQSLYRPFTSIAFAVQWAVGEGSPLPFHAVNIALYAAVCAALFRLARQIMDERAAAIGAAVFAVHPLHVEAIANIVGQAELWVALISILGVSYYLTKRNAGRMDARSALTLSAMYGAALMFKEHAIVLPGLLLAAEVILPPADGGRARARVRRITPILVGMTTVAAVFVVVRTAVIGRIAGGSTATVFIGQDFLTRLFTMLKVVPEWMRLFFWPANLSADYSPPRIETATAFDASMIPGLVVLFGGVAIAIRMRRDHPALAYAFALAGISLLIPSNLFVVTGFVLAERALFMASAGVALILGFAASTAISAAPTRAVRRAIAVAVGVVLVTGVVRSSWRSTVWSDNETLFRQTVQDVPSSYRAHLMFGELLTDEGKSEEGLGELLLAVRLSRKGDFFVRWFAADRFHAAGKLRTASLLYRDALALKPSDQTTRYGAAMCLAALGRNAEARAMAAEGLKRDPADERFVRIVHVIDSVGVVNSVGSGETGP